MPVETSTTDEEERWPRLLEAACEVRCIGTREGIVFDESTGQISDAMAWELEHDDD